MHSDLVKALSMTAVGATLVAGVFLMPAVAQDTLPPGPGMEETMKGCGGCHGVGQILTEKRSAEEWSATVTMMITNGAPVSDADFDKVVGYLATYFGTNPPPAPGAAPAAAAPVAGVAPAEAAPVAPAPAGAAPAAPAAEVPTVPATGATQPPAGGTAPAAQGLPPAPAPAPAQ